MSDVFISYSRSDREFVRKLFDALESKGYDAWIDWQDIEYAEDWWQKICAGIEQADNFVFVITPQSVQSKVCYDEIEHATKNNKRIVPVLHQEIEDKDLLRQMHPTISKHNWLPFTESDVLDKTFADLVETIHRDPDHLRSHTRLLVRAHEWERSDRRPSLLLRGDDLQIAEQWLTVGVNKDPVPTDLHAAFIAASRAAARTIQRRLFYAVSLALVVAIGLMMLSLALFQNANAERNRADANVTFAVAAQQTSEFNAATAIAAQSTSAFNAQEAVTQAAIADRRAEVAQSLALASSARETSNTNQIDAIALAMAAVQIDDPPETAQNTLRELVYAPGPRRTIAVPSGTRSIVISPRGDKALTLSQGEIRLWDANTGDELWRKTSDDLDQSGAFIAFSPDGSQVLTRTASGVRLWRTDAGDVAGDYIDSRIIRGALLLDDEKSALLGFEDGSIIEWDFAGEESTHELPALDGRVRHLDFSGNATRVLYLMEDGQILLRDLASGDTLFSDLLTENFGRVALSEDGSIGAFASRQELVFWDFDSGQQLASFADYTPLASGIAFNIDVDVSPDGTRALTTAFDGSLTLWDVENRQQLHRLSGHSSLSYSATFAADGKTAISTDTGGRAIVWDLARGDVLPVPDYSSEFVAFGPQSGNAVFRSQNGELETWDYTTGEQIGMLTEPSPFATWHGFDSTGRLALVTSGSELVLWDHESERVDQELGTNVFPNAHFSPDGDSVITRARWIDLATGETIKAFEQPNLIISTAIGPDGETVLQALSSGQLLLWQLDQSDPIHEVLAADGDVIAAAVDPNSNLALISGIGRNVTIWDIASGSVRFVLDENIEIVPSVAFSPDGQMAATSSIDGVVVFWDVDTGQVAQTFREHDGDVFVTAFSPDGRAAISVGSDKSVIYRLDPLEAVVDWAIENRVVRNLTCEELETFDATLDCRPEDG